VNTARSEPSRSQLTLLWVGSITELEVLDVLVDDMVLVVDEFVTGNSVLVLKLLLDNEEINIVGRSMTGRVLLDLELELALVLVAMVEEFAVLGIVLELDIELVTMTDDAIGDTETLELNRLLRLEVVKVVDELEIGYKTLLELDLLSDPEVRVEVVVPVVGTAVSVVLSPELETTELDDERLVDTDERDDPEELGNIEELLEPGRLEDAVLDEDTVGLKMTSAKI
jgi:hypothetical protein